jgi:acetyltransferase-like isoleucine patch superfamily enzyme
MAQQSVYAKYRIGAWTYGRPTVLDWGDGSTLKIGKYCSIADGVKILVGGEHNHEWITTYPFVEMWQESVRARNDLPDRSSRSKGDVTIENDVWIGADALVLSGVTISNGAVVGAGSIVTRDVPSYAVVAGCPARVLRIRFDKAVVASLEQIAWWEWSDDRVRDALPLLLSDRIDVFIDRHGAQ